MKKVLSVILVVLMFLLMFTGCTQAERVSANISQQADSFNVTRQFTVINTRAEDGNVSILFQMTGNFSIQKTGDGDVDVIGENPDGTFYKHFVYLSQDITYVVQDLDSTAVNKHKFEINFNPKMIIPVQPVIVD
jgi:outer membrane lipoprotein-sorting protein